MKNNIRLSLLFAALAVFVAGAGIEAPAPSDLTSASDGKSSWSAAFPVAQAGFAQHAATTAE